MALFTLALFGFRCELVLVRLSMTAHTLAALRMIVNVVSHRLVAAGALHLFMFPHQRIRGLLMAAHIERARAKPGFEMTASAVLTLKLLLMRVILLVAVLAFGVGHRFLEVHRLVAGETIDTSMLALERELCRRVIKSVFDLRALPTSLGVALLTPHGKCPFMRVLMAVNTLGILQIAKA